MVSGENVDRQHRIAVCSMTTEIKKRKPVKTEARITRWKLKKEENLKGSGW